jgi:CheY-like chemotaxis protein
MLSCLDITEQERMRRDLQRTQRLEALSQFAAGIAHDFNNLLTGLFGSLDLEEPQDTASEPAELRRAMVLRSFERARDLAQRLLRFGKGSSLQRHTINVADILKESCTLSLSGSATNCQCPVGDQLWHVRASASELSQVFNNIILNARQAMQDFGMLTILAHNRTVGQDDVGGLTPGDYVVIQFHDTGPGIAGAALEQIFDPYFTTKPGGSGLGLATSHAIIKEYGGRITAGASPGGGAMFEVWLPAVRDVEASVFPDAGPDASRGSGRVLLMDDDEIIRISSARVLERRGFEVTSAAAGEQALELYGKAMADGRPYDLVILDLTVPGGMGGEAVLAELRKTDPDVAALASSGYSDDATASRVLAAGFVGLLGKPYLAHELCSTVKAAMSRQ